jgi:ethanolamine ammonia-lyase small subunit
MKKIELTLSAPIVSEDPWAHLKKHTQARIALGRVGTSLPTVEVLGFGLAHAMARDAVHLALDVDVLESEIHSLNFASVRVHSKASDRASYLLRPDLGRRLDEDSLHRLESMVKASTSKPIDLLIVIADGLSSLAVSRHVQPLLEALQKIIPTEWNLGPIVIASQARVAIGDEIGLALGARMVAMLIGERPGLSASDSLGIYLTYAPCSACSDADRNCISNVRPEGLHYVGAAKKLIWLAKEALRLKLSGVALKDESDIREIGEHVNANLDIHISNAGN